MTLKRNMGKNESSRYRTGSKQGVPIMSSPELQMSLQDSPGVLEKEEEWEKEMVFWG